MGKARLKSRNVYPIEASAYAFDMQPAAQMLLSAAADIQCPECAFAKIKNVIIAFKA
ncbi:MAG: hypothetical protein AAF633_07675 [Chloroflexota bacterium]